MSGCEQVQQVQVMKSLSGAHKQLQNWFTGGQPIIMMCCTHTWPKNVWEGDYSQCLACYVCDAFHLSKILWNGVGFYTILKCASVVPHPSILPQTEVDVIFLYCGSLLTVTNICVMSHYNSLIKSFRKKKNTKEVISLEKESKLNVCLGVSLLRKNSLWAWIFKKKKKKSGPTYYCLF